MQSEKECPICFENLNLLKDDNNNTQELYQLECKCSGSLYHLKCLRTYFNTLNSVERCCYCRRVIPYNIILKIKGIEAERVNKEEERYVTKIIKRVVKTNIMMNLLSIIIYYQYFKTLVDFAQFLQISETVFCFRIILWLNDESPDTHDIPANFLMGMNSLKMLIMFFYTQNQFVFGSQLILFMMNYGINSFLS